VEVKAPGYMTRTDTIAQRPTTYNVQSDVKLDRSKPSYDLDSTSAVVAFDKLMADIKDGTPVGSWADALGKSTPIKWEGSVKVGDKAFDQRFYEILTDAGIRTPMRENAKLFAGSSEGRQQLPRYVVGAELLEMNIDLQHSKVKDYGAGKFAGRTRTLVDWKVLDKRGNKVVLTVRTEGIHRFRQVNHYGGNQNLLAFEDALYKFLDDGRFIDLIRSSTTPAQSAGVDLEAKSLTIKPVSIPAFKSISEMIRHADKSCVTIITDGGHGSGVIINSEGYTLSAYHVVEGINRIEVQFSDGMRQEARILASDVENDLVLLDISGSGFRPLPLGDEESSGLGDEVVTIGTPADVSLGQSVAKGILSGKRKIEDKVYLQTDVAVSPGNSGGPLLNAEGQVIGIVQSKIVGKGIEGLSFAIPIGRVKELLGLSVEE
jgi:S1-C subfamily serine protease